MSLPGRLVSVLVALLLSRGSYVSAQISPGELSAPHAHLDDLSHCTSCHDLGKKMSGDKCLDCHRALQTRIGARKGFHGMMPDQTCTTCHKEHFGRDFPIVKWDPRTFDHAVTGYRLQGKHGALECRRCHTPANVRADDVRSNAGLLSRGTYLGLDAACQSCHADPHGRALGPECATCHTQDGWKPAPGFSHDKTRFALTGRHQTTACASCHRGNGVAGTPPVYRGLSFSDCSSCHASPHRQPLSGRCSSCHSAADWSGARLAFNHATTRFPLNGKHTLVPCAQCHGASQGRSGQTRQVIRQFGRCSDCHGDPHNRQFASFRGGGACTSCHNENGWNTAAPTGFEHASTRFPLKGKHASARCAGCHVQRTNLTRGFRNFDPATARICKDCHDDYHQGQFARRPDGGACQTCHTEQGFVPSLFSLAAHQRSQFQLTGAHRAVPCGKCHPARKSAPTSGQQYRIPHALKCETCHEDPHKSRYSRWMKEGCASCHGTERWQSLRYAHKTTRFALTGAHRRVDCDRCHRRDDGWQFIPVSTACASCHGTLSSGASG